MSMLSALPTKVIAVAIAAGLVVAAGSGVADAAPKHRATISVHVTKKHHQVVAPALTRPGLVHVRNTGSHEIILIAKKHAGVSRLVKDINRSEVSNRLVRDFSFIGALDPHSDAYVKLGRGTLYLVDGEVDKVTASEVHSVRVSGKKLSAKGPRSRTVLVDAHGKVRLPATLPRQGYLHLINNSGSIRVVFGFGVGKSATTAQIDAFLADPTDDNFIALRPNGNIAPSEVLAPHTSRFYAGYRAAAGRYIVLEVGPNDKVSGNLIAPKGQVSLLTVR
jgi:hypothetical protein